MPKNQSHWKLTRPLDAIVLDCDSTLSHIEGIDELAKHRGVEKEVAAITNKCMSTAGLNVEIYAERLNLVKPTLTQVQALAAEYIAHLAPHALPVIKTLQRLGKTVYVISGGITQAIIPICAQLGITSEYVYAVDLKFDAQGNYAGFDTTSPLVTSTGKPTIIEKIKLQHPSIAMVGDGLTDYYTIDLVTRFIGYGGATIRKHLKEKSPFYILAPTLLPLLPLCLTTKEQQQLNNEEQQLYVQGLTAIDEGQVIMQEKSHV